jgi:hypothetical protein
VQHYLAQLHLAQLHLAQLHLAWGYAAAPLRMLCWIIFELTAIESGL